MAREIADGTKTLSTLATEYGLGVSHMRQIACGARVPRIKEMVDAIVEENARSVIRIAKAQARMAVAKLAVMARNAPDPNTQEQKYSEDVEMAAAKELLRLALADVPEANKSYLEVSGGVVLLADVIKSRGEIPADRAAALGLTSMVDGNGHGGNGHAPRRLTGPNGDGNGHADGNGHGASEETNEG